MKIGFLYNGPCDVTQITQNPTYDASAAVCFLAIQLAKLGHGITIFSQTPNHDTFNLRLRQFEIKDQALRLDPTILEKDFTVLIFKNTSPDFAISICNALPYKPKIYLWTDYDYTAPINQNLIEPNIIQALTAIICVSNSQRNTLADKLSIPKDKCVVIEDAIAPVFEDLFIDGKELTQVKSQDPKIAYIAAQDDGLDILLESYYDISTNYQKVSLDIFVAVTDQNLLNDIQNLRGIKVYGIQPKRQLATLLRTYTIFANPNTIVKTSNISLLETMAAGLYPVTSDIGANLYYAHGHGKIVATEKMRGNNLDNYISELLAVCQAQVHYSGDFYDYCFKQSLEMNKKHTWRVKAKEWEDLLGKLSTAPMIPTKL